MKDLDHAQKTVGEWANMTFPQSNATSILAHLREEVAELTTAEPGPLAGDDAGPSASSQHGVEPAQALECRSPTKLHHHGERNGSAVNAAMNAIPPDLDHGVDGYGGPGWRDRMQQDRGCDQDCEHDLEVLVSWRVLYGLTPRTSFRRNWGQTRFSSFHRMR